MARTKTRTYFALAVGVIAMCAGLPGSALPQQPAGAGTQPNQAPPSVATTVAPLPDPKVTLADFLWIEGRWQGAWGPRVAEQDWMAPKAGVMLGMFRVVEGDHTLVIELFTLVEQPHGIEFHVRHFTPALVPWEKGGTAVLTLASLDPKNAVFENLVDGEPKRVILTRVAPDSYVERSEIVSESGSMQSTEITYHRQKLAGGPASGGSGGRR